MAVREVVQTVRMAVQIWAADPVTGNPSAPPGATQARANKLWEYGGWIFAVAAALAALAALVVAMFNHQAGRPNDGLAKLGVILACCIGAGAITGTIGALTGT
jgi:ABC-type xylose transport system permease subunit